MFIGVVLALSFLLLMLVFRSLLVPLKAVIMNLLSLAAAFGIVTAIFQWGWGGELLGIEPAPIEPFVPMMMFAIVFGLSMDYEVFLLSRIREEFVRTGDSRGSVADGLALTARVITAAAAIMVVVFGSFIGETDRLVKLFGVGLPVRYLSTPPSSACCWSPRRWSCSVMPTGGCRSGSIGCCQRSRSKVTPSSLLRSRRSSGVDSDERRLAEANLVVIGRVGTDLPESVHYPVEHAPKGRQRPSEGAPGQRSIMRWVPSL